MLHSSCHCLRVVGNSEGDMLHSSCHCLRVVGPVVIYAALQLSLFEGGWGDMLHSSCHCLRVVGNSEGDMLHSSCHICCTPVVIV